MAEEELFVILPRESKMIAPHRTDITLQELSTLPLVLPRPGQGLRRRITLRGGVPTSTVDLLITFARGGQEIATFGPKAKDEYFRLYFRRFDLESGQELATWPAGGRPSTQAPLTSPVVSSKAVAPSPRCRIVQPKTAE